MFQKIQCSVCQGAGRVYAVRNVWTTSGVQSEFEPHQCAACLGHGYFDIVVYTSGGTVTWGTTPSKKSEEH